MRPNVLIVMLNAIMVNVIRLTVTALLLVTTKNTTLMRLNVLIVILGAIMMNVIRLTVAASLLVSAKSTTLMLAKCFYCHAGCNSDQCR
jgi:hypothetical protein